MWQPLIDVVFRVQKPSAGLTNRLVGSILKAWMKLCWAIYVSPMLSRTKVCKIAYAELDSDEHLKGWSIWGMMSTPFHLVLMLRLRGAPLPHVSPSTLLHICDRFAFFVLNFNGIETKFV